MKLLQEQLARVIQQDKEPYAKAYERAGVWLPHIQVALDRFKINTTKRVAAFLGQIALESGGLSRVVENLNYSARGLSCTWKTRYALRESNGNYLVGQPNRLALSLDRKPQAIANNVYANRMGNGDEASGDGWKFRGRGLKQLTGRENYTKCGKDLGVDFVSNPDLVATPEYAALTAGWFWEANGLAKYADADDYKGMTKAINGGLIGYDDGDRSDKDTRVDYWIVAKKLIGAA